MRKIWNEISNAQFAVYLFLVLLIPGLILLLSALGGFHHICSCNESSSAFAPTYFLWNIEKEIEAIFKASISILGGISEAHKTRGELGC